MNRLADLEQMGEVESLRTRVADLEVVLAKSQAAQVAAEQRLRTLVDFAPEAIVMLDVATGRFIDVNPMTERLFGLSRDKLLEIGPFDLSPPSQPTGPSLIRGQEKVALALSGAATEFEWWHCNVQRERFLTEVQLVRMPWGDRDVIRGTIVDIGARKQLELSERGRSRILEGIARGEPLNALLEGLTRTIEALLPEMFCSILLLDHGQNCLRVGAAPSLPEFYSAAVDGVAIGPSVGSCGAAAFTRRRVIVSDIQTHPNWETFRPIAEQANLRACWSEPILSFAGRVLGTFAMYYHEPREPAAVELRAIEIAAGLATLAIEHESSRRSLHELNETLERRVAEKANRLLEFHQRLQSADAQIEANQLVREREAALARSERLATMGQMAAELAHELNQPLFAIANFATVTRQAISGLSNSGSELSDKMQCWVEQIQLQAQRSAEMIRRVLQFVRKDELNRECLNLNELIRNLSLLLKFGLRNKSIQVDYQLAQDLDPVEVDRVPIEQVLINLVRNAADAMEDTPPERQKIVVRTFQAETGQVGVAVSDSGHGLSVSQVDRLFEPYFTTKPEGCGMGLAICRSTIDAHHGRIWATNNPSGGTTFQFTLPSAKRLTTG